MSEFAPAMVKRAMLTPVIERELRIQSRRAATYWLRVLAGAAAIAALGSALLGRQEFAIFRATGHGAWLFALLHTAICLVFALSCPLLIADALSRERREGTLGILLLTPLTVASVVRGKVATHLLRAFGLWLAAAPALVVPVLLGGVGPVDVLFVLVLELGVVLGSLSAGLLASTVARDSGSAAGLALLFTVIIGEALAVISFLAFLPAILANPTSEYRHHLFLTATFGPWLLGTGLLEKGFSGILGRGPGWLRSAIHVSLAAVFIASWAIALASVAFAAWRVRRWFPAGGLSVEQERRREFWRQPILLTGFGRRLTSWQLSRNPMMWLYGRHAAGGLGQVAWCALVLLVWTGIAAAGWNDRDLAFFVFAPPILVTVGLAHAASGCFREEQQNGALELLLVSPVPVASIVRAKLVALWVAFAPALVLGLALALCWMNLNDNVDEDGLMSLALAASAFVALPPVGARFSVRRLGPIGAWISTMVVVGAVPAVVARFVNANFGPPPEAASEPWRFLGLMVGIQWSLAAFCAWSTVTDLRTRAFQLRPLRRRPS